MPRVSEIKAGIEEMSRSPAMLAGQVARAENVRAENVRDEGILREVTHGEVTGDELTGDDASLPRDSTSGGRISRRQATR